MNMFMWFRLPTRKLCTSNPYRNTSSKAQLWTMWAGFCVCPCAIKLCVYSWCHAHDKMYQALPLISRNSLGTRLPGYNPMRHCESASTIQLSNWQNRCHPHVPISLVTCVLQAVTGQQNLANCEPKRCAYEYNYVGNFSTGWIGSLTT